MSQMMIGQPAPAFALQNLEGETVRLEDFRGRMALVTFWSAECPWVERADREMVAWSDRVALIAIASNASEPAGVLRSAAEARGLPLVLVDADQCVADLYGVQITPHCFLIDADGVLRYQGAFDDVSFRQRTPTRNYIFEAVQALEAGQPVAPAETPPFGCTIVRKEAPA